MKTQLLGASNLARCSAVTGRPYVMAEVNGGIPAGWARCWRQPGDTALDRAPILFPVYDWVNRFTGETLPGTGSLPVVTAKHRRQEALKKASRVKKRLTKPVGPDVRWAVPYVVEEPPFKPGDRVTYREDSPGTPGQIRLVKTAERERAGWFTEREGR